jgi:pimeloyl-ACP methyl ester carboxylesterase
MCAYWLPKPIWWQVPTVLLVAGLGLTRCISIRMSDRAVAKYFKDKPVKPTFHFAPLGDARVHYAEMGTTGAPLVVFIHGSPGSWDAFISYYTDSAFYAGLHLLSIDRPGYGKSGLGNAEPSLHTQAAAIYAILQQAAPGQKAVLAGHSLGGPVAVRFAIDYPDATAGLVLIAPSVDPAMEKEEWYRPFLNKRIVRVLLPTELDVSNQEIMPLKAELIAMLPHWREILAPVTILQGTDDSLVSPANARFAARKLVRSQRVKVVMLEDMNHFIPWRRPEVIKRAIVQIALRPAK